MPIHVIRQWKQVVSSRGSNWAIIFLDLTTAFDATIRERMFGVDEGEDVEAALDGLGLDQD
eukprot:4686909-Alexandrium_andersonii.AAC.1